MTNTKKGEIVFDKYTEEHERQRVIQRGMELLFKGMRQRYLPDMRVGAIMLREASRTPKKDDN